jgi:pyruvate dehydrogenase E2 component (dihydrolipoamide acetyltransferase)
MRMPEVAAGATEAVLAAWNVVPGASFAAGDLVVTVETDKAIVDVEADADGVLLRTLVEPGATVEVGGPIALLGAAGEQVDDVDQALAELGVGAPVAASSDDDVAQGPGETAPPAAVLPAATTSVAEAADHDGRVFASPLARRLAREAGVPLAQLTGSGPDGRIRRRDVEAYVSHRPAGPTVAAAAVATDDFWDEPVSRMRSAIAARLTQSVQTAPHFYVRGRARVDRLLELRREINDGGGVKVSVNDLVVKAVAKAHTVVPELNVVWTGDTVRHFAHVDVAIAVATAHGLVTPVVRGVDRLTVTELAAATQDLVVRAQEKRLQQSELEGGTVSVSNLGMFGTEEFSAIINPPQSSILAVGAARQEPVAVDGALAVATVLRVTLSVDHRPVDGATAARWMQAFVELLEHPARILA